MSMSDDAQRRGASAPSPQAGPAASNEPAGYRAPPPGPWGAPASAFQAAYAPPAALTATVAPSIYGDSAGEYLRMSRGRYNAWPHVVLAFLYQMVVIGGIVGGLLFAGLTLVAGESDVVAMIGLGAALVVGVAGAWLSFRDRWKCIEAFSSRFCIGLLNLSILYVPVVAFVYANVRAVQKLGGR